MVREPAVAGQFYPGSAGELAADVDSLLDAVSSPGPPARGYLVPHAGYQYSGPTAARVYAELRGRSDVDRVVLLGPAHFVLTRGCAVPAAQGWLTPLGEVPIDLDGVRALAQRGLVAVDDRPHRPEHSIEVQLPFLQRCLGTFRVLPIAVGVSDVDSVAQVLAAATQDGDRTVVICSSDLSHYLDEATATARDEETLRSVVALTPQKINVRDACGVYALRGLLGWARLNGLEPRVLDRCTSAQTGGDPARVVGYAAVRLAVTA